MRHKVVFIDWHGTLSSSPFWRRWEETQGDKWQAVQHFFHTHSGVIERWMIGQETAESISEGIAKISTNLTSQEVLAELRRSCQQMQFDDTTTIKLINQLQSRGYKVVIATDNMDTFGRWTIPALQLRSLFDDILDSYSLKCLKRDKDEDGISLFFGNYLKVNDMSPTDSILFDDNAPYVTDFGMDYRKVTAKMTLRQQLLDYLNET